MADLKITFDWKLAKLEKLIEISIPDDAKSLKEVNGAWAVSAIGEANKMQGHLEAVTTNINCNALIEATEIVKQLEDSHKKDY
jgi:hypothetical protein